MTDKADQESVLEGGSVAASVIIPTRDGEGRLPGLLDALSRQTTDRPWEVIVVEDGSARIPPQTVAQPPAVRLVRQRQGGPGSARNRGASLARGEYLVFVDDDCLPEPQWLEQMLLPFSDPRVVGIKGAYATDQSGVVARFVQAEYEEKFARLARKPHVNFVDGYSAAFRRQAFLEAGGFDESFPLPSVEDREFSLRLSRGEGRLVFNPRAVVRHRHVASFSGYLAKKLKYGRWGVRILRAMPAEFVADDHTPHSQRFQVVLMPVLPVALAACWLYSPWALAAWAAGFWSSALPLVRRAWGHGWGVGLAALPLVFLRALGLATGLAWGLISALWETGPTRHPGYAGKPAATDSSRARG